MNIGKESKSKLSLVSAMLIFGTVGVFSKYIPLPSGMIALARAVIGAVFLASFMLISKKKPDIAKIKSNLALLLSSGVCLGVNWILFFMACKNTTITTATLSYYLAPLILVFSSAVIFGEKLGVKQIALTVVSLFGIALASGIVGESASGVKPLGILYGVLAAFFYATVVTLNKKMKDIDPIDKTLVQFVVSAIAILPYVIFVERASEYTLNSTAVCGLVVIGVVHTGFAYLLYFGSATRLKSATVAILSYIDPVTSILISVLFFSEKIGILGILGAVLVIGSAAFGEINLSEFSKVKSRVNNNKNHQ